MPVPGPLPGRVLAIRPPGGGQCGQGTSYGMAGSVFVADTAVKRPP